MEEKDRLGNYDILQKSKVGSKEIGIGCDLSQEKCYCVMNMQYVMDGLFRTGSELMQTSDYMEAYQEYINRQQKALDHCREAQTDRRVLTADACQPGSNLCDYMDQVVVIGTDYFAPEYRNATNQLAWVQSGNGAKPDGIGTKVYVQSLSDGEKYYCRRGDVLGIVRPEAMPEWAGKKLDQLKQKQRDAQAARKAPQKEQRR